MMESVLFCTFLLETSVTLHPTNHCRKVSSAPNLLPKRIFWPRFGAFQSSLPSSSCATRPELAPDKYPPSILHTHALRPTSSSRLFWPAAEAFSSHLFGQTHLMSILLSPSNIKGRAAAAILYLDHGSRTSLLPAGPLTCLHI